jgi:hypothetical protein
MVHDGFVRFFARVAATHMVTYFVAGVLAFFLLDYATTFQSEHFACWMRPTTSKWVAIGPGLQWIRGLVFAAALYPFRHVFLEGARGWLKLWGLLVGLGILSTYGPAPGSVEGLIYTTIPPLGQLRGLSEVVGQSLAFSVLLVAWYRRPGRAWGVVLYSLTVLVILMSVAGVLAAQRDVPR